MSRFAIARQRFFQQMASEWEGPAALQEVAQERPVRQREKAPGAPIPGAISANDAAPTTATAPLLQVQNVSLVYATARQQVRATHRINLEVFEGDRFVLLGASGCGKSSLLKALGGFLQPTEGQILLDGQPVHGPGPDRVVVFQEFDQLPPWKTVRENVMFPLLASGQLGRVAAGERADAMLAKVGLAQFAQAHPHQLSGGMKQRVAIARALAMQPRVLLMDEPFAALDALTRRRMQEELLALWEELRFTLVFVTHSIEEALVVGNRIAILSPHPGRVRAELNSHEFGLASQGSAAFQAATQRIHRLLFETPASEVHTTAEAPESQSPAQRELAASAPPPWASVPVNL